MLVVEHRQLIKQAFSQCFGSGCEEQVALDLVRDEPQALPEPLVCVFQGNERTQPLWVSWPHSGVPVATQMLISMASQLLPVFGDAQRKPSPSPIKPSMSIGFSTSGSVIKSWAERVASGSTISRLLHR